MSQMRQSSSKVLTDVVEKISLTTSLPMVTGIVAEAARALSGADGATFVLRDGDKCFYADEDAISPLWKGKRFPLDACISGWSMKHRQVVVIQDIYQDERIPHDAYRPTFVKSLCMVPIRAENPVGAIGNYWANGYCPTEEEIKLLQVLANSAAIALENLQLKQSVLEQSQLAESFIGLEKNFVNAIHTLAHDLKNPLSTMLLFAELLQVNLMDRLDERLNGYINSILRTGQQANTQIKKMLSMYSVVNKNLEKEKVNLSLIFQEISEQLQAAQPSRKVELEIEPDLTTYADPALIRLALENLISNAFKYTSKKEIARIQFKKFDENTISSTFLIEDNGDGFDSALGQNLFRPLVRLHEDTEFPGTGLGLASVARILELHGGAIRAEGQKSIGAKFYLSLPIGSA